MLLTNKIYEGNLFMRYSKHLTYAERMFLRARLNRVRHITLDPDGPGVVRIHLVPCHKPDRETPFTAILNGQDILPLNVSWAILLTNFIEALKPYTGREIRPEEWSAINAQAVAVLGELGFARELAQVVVEGDADLPVGRGLGVGECAGQDYVAAQVHVVEYGGVAGEAAVGFGFFELYGCDQAVHHSSSFLK